MELMKLRFGRKKRCWVLGQLGEKANKSRPVCDVHDHFTYHMFRLHSEGRVVALAVLPAIPAEVVHWLSLMHACGVQLVSG